MRVEERTKGVEERMDAQGKPLCKAALGQTKTLSFFLYFVRREKEIISKRRCQAFVSIPVLVTLLYAADWQAYISREGLSQVGFLVSEVI